MSLIFYYISLFVLVILSFFSSLLSLPITPILDALIGWYFVVGVFYAIGIVFHYMDFLLKYWVDFYYVSNVLDLCYNKVYYDWIVNIALSENLLKCAYFLYKIFDKGILEILGPTGFAATAWNLIKNYKKYSSGYTYNYVCLFIIGIFFIIGIIKYFF